MTRTVDQSPRISPEVMGRYEAVIGLEVHAQLKTRTKAFCGCSTRFGDPPNTNVCPVCLGLPGALPVLNGRAVELAVRASLALHAKIHGRSRFARKNYFYPDLPKGYQISQYELPLATEGLLDFEFAGAVKRVGITRLHLEEDAAKNLHEGFPDSDRWSYIDFNRCGVPLIEIVSEPELHTPKEAEGYLNRLRELLEGFEVSDCKMEEGSLRCDANVSVRLRATPELGTKVEIKNLNSVRFLGHALNYEVERQIEVLESGSPVSQETRLWNVRAGRTEPMRSKEFAHDYRYFPDPDLLPVSAPESLVAEVKRGMPKSPDELRAEGREQLVQEYGFTADDANVLTQHQALKAYFHATLAGSNVSASFAFPWIKGEFLRHANEMGFDEASTAVPPTASGALIAKVESGKIPAAVAKNVYAKMFETGKSDDEIIAAEGLSQMTDTAAIERIARAIIAANPDNVAKYRSGNEGVFKFFVGQVMKETRGQANPQVVNELLKRILTEP